MSLSLKALIRNHIVDDATMRGLLGATTTASASVQPTFMEQSGTYPSITYSITEGTTDPGMDSQNGFVTFAIEVQGSGTHPHIAFGEIQNRLSGLFDDQPLSGAAITGTAIYSYLFLREGGVPVGYVPERKVYQKLVNYSFKLTGG